MKTDRNVAGALESDSQCAADPTAANQIAIIGIAGRFPGARDVKEFWINLIGGIESLRQFGDDELARAGINPLLIADASYVKTRGTLSDVDRFDAAFFGFQPREAELTDPQHRVFLECAWEVIEGAGYDPGSYDRPIGVFAGLSMNTYFLCNLCPDRVTVEDFVGSYQAGNYHTHLGNDKDFLPTRVSYKLNLKGPSLNIQTGCSSSLVAVCQACQSLLMYQCDMALAGGASITFPQERGYLYQEGAMLSPDGHCRAFDSEARGTVFSSGAGVVLLKRLEDATADGDSIYAVIRGSAINNDGAGKVSYTAPSVDGQAEVINMAQAVAGVRPDTITYIEAHGTGTPLGDPIEIAALTKAFRSDSSETGFCAIGSVKTNIGHLDAASGIAGLIKTALALKHRQIPPSLNYTRPNPHIDFGSSPFYVSTKLTAWPAGSSPRRAGVSSFGVGGTNAHVVLEEAPEAPISSTSRPWQLLLLSARTDSALDAATANLAAHLRDSSDLDFADAAYTLKVGRRSFSQRRALVCQTREEAVDLLSNCDRRRVLSGSPDEGDRSVAFLFPGQGSQYSGMGAELYASEATFRHHVDLCAELLMPELGLDLRSILFEAGEEAAEQLNQTIFTQPALFMIEYALAQLWMEWGLQPQAMIGHSIGEYVAACLAGVFSLEDALRIVAARARLIQQLPGGAMLAVRLSEENVRPLLGDRLSLAAINAPSLCVVSGPEDAVNSLQAMLSDQKVACRRLRTSHAFHSAMMDPMLDEFIALLEKATMNVPRLPYLSNVTGDWITAKEATSPAYWALHLRQAVRFTDNLGHLMQDPRRVLLEVGPGQALSTLARQHPSKSSGHTMVASLVPEQEPRSEVASLLAAAGRLWLAGVSIDWAGFYNDERRHRICLPTYPFERKRYWVNPVNSNTPSNSTSENAMANNAVMHGNGHPSPSHPLPMVAMDEPIQLAHDPPVHPTAIPDRRDRIVSTLRDLLCKASGLEAASMEETISFLEMGFDSLFLTQASQMFHKEFKVKITFRQLLGDLSNLRDLSIFLDSKLPPEAFATAVPAVTAAALPINETAPASTLTPTQTLPATRAMNRIPAADIAPAGLAASAAGSPFEEAVPIAGARGIETVIQQQLQIMARQLEVLRGATALTGDPTLNPSAAAPLASMVVVPATPQPDSPTADAPPASAQESANFKAFGPYKPIDKGRGTEFTPEQIRYITDLVNRYTLRTPGSRRVTQQYRSYHADPRAAAGFRAQWKEMVYPIVVERSAGSKLWDIDGNEYIDILNGFGVTMFGHSPQFVTDAVEQQIKRGVEIGPQTPLAGQVAELICELTGMDRACFCNTGSEAVMAAIRVARTVTARDKIVLFTGAYHGTFDEVLVRPSYTSGDLAGAPIAPGIPAEKTANVLVLEYGTTESLEILKTHANELAAVLVETVQSRRPDLQPLEFLQEVRAITAASGTALIFDEVVTGFRVHPGGVQALFGIRADMATYGKVIGGGYPVGVLAGRREYMDALDGGMWAYGDSSIPETGVTFHAGTFVRHPLAMAAAFAVLSHLKAAGPALQEQLTIRAGRFAAALNHFFEQRQVPTRIRNFGSMLYFSFPHDLRGASLFYYGLRLRGIHIMEGFPCFLTTAHTDEDLDRIIQAFQETTVEMQAIGLLPGGGENPAPSGISPAAAVSRAPLTAAQKEIWLSVQMGDDASCAYNESCTITIPGGLDVSALRRAASVLIGRHDSLRSRFSPNGDYQEFTSDTSIELPYDDLSRLDPAGREAAVAGFIEAEACTPFDLINGPVVRLRVLGLNASHQVVLLTVHHLVCDGWSIGVLVKELAALYTREVGAGAPAMEDAMQFGEYALLEDQQRNSIEAVQSAAYWKAQFAEPPPLMELPSDRPRPTLKSYNGSMERAIISGPQLANLKKAAGQQGATLFSLLLAGFKVLMYRLSGQGDLAVGIPAAGQPMVGSPALIGHCLNFLPLRSKINGEAPFNAYLAELQDLVLDAYERQNFTYGTLIQELDLPRDTSRLPLLSTMFNLDPAGIDSIDFAGVKADLSSNAKRFTNMDLFLNIFQTESELRLECDFNTDLFDPGTVRRWLGHYQTLLEAMITNPSQPIAELPLLGAVERQQLLEDWNDTAAEYSRDRCTHQLIEDQVTRTPDAIAIAFENQEITYREMNERANHLAHRLRSFDIRPDTAIGLCMERSIEMVIGALAIWKAGGAYVPMDPAYPEERLAFMLEDAEMPVVVTESGLAPRLEAHGATVLLVDRGADADHTAGSLAENLEVPVAPENLAYTIFTSGSTGRPKGVQIPHRALVNFLESMRREPGLTSSDVLAAVTTLSFDIAGLELWLPLIVGAKCVIISRNVSIDGGLLAEALNTSGATVLQATPATFQMLVEAQWRATRPMKLLCGGEALSRGLADRLLECGAEIWNMYGPTETTIWSSITRVGAGSGPIPLGAPIANTQFYVLDSNLEPCAIGVPGELYIGGDGLARGYLNRSDLTAEKFVISRFTAAGTRLYKTGDLVRYTADGTLEFLGRIDQQVKIRGFRVETEEIETVLEQFPEVEKSVVDARVDTLGNRRLVAYIVPASSRETAASAWEREQTRQWEMIYGSASTENALRSTGAADATLNIYRWTALDNAEADLNEWLVHTASRILSQRPDKVLEIGCGTGTLLERIAPCCREVCGTDISVEGLESLRRRLESLGPEYTHVSLVHSPANNFDAIQSSSFDAVILNSVVEYFPDLAYLTDVLEGAVNSVRPGGFVFVGDIQSFPLWDAYHTADQVRQASPTMPTAELKERVRRRKNQDNRLVVDPEYFYGLKDRISNISSVEMLLMRGNFSSEVTQLHADVHYDVIIHVGDAPGEEKQYEWLSWSNHNLAISDLKVKLKEERPEILCLTDVPNHRLMSRLEAARIMREADAPKTVEALTAAITHDDRRLDLENIWALGEDTLYGVNISWTGDGTLGTCDVVLRRRTADDSPKIPVPRRPSAEKVAHSSKLLGTNPAWQLLASELPDLRERLREHLPEYMVPAVIVPVDAMPLTPNNKVDRRALPEPDWPDTVSRTELTAPRTSDERVMAGIWAEVLGLQYVDVNTGLFELGADSLLIFQIVTKARDAGIAVTPRHMFALQTIDKICKAIRNEHSAGAIVALSTSGSNPPLFCIHRTDGTVTCYQELAKHLGSNQPVYGLQAIGLNGEVDSVHRLEDIASQYVDEICSAYPTGPYFLAGASYGGIIAFEMAIQLRARGKSVGLLAMLDTLAPIAFQERLYERRTADRLSVHQSIIRSLDTRAKLDYIRTGVKKRLGRTLQRSGYGFDRRETPELLREIEAAIEQSVLRYTPAAYPDRIVLMRASEINLFDNYDPELWWGDRAAGGIDIIDVPGNHLTMMTEPNVQILAQRLTDRIRVGMSNA